MIPVMLCIRGIGGLTIGVESSRQEKIKNKKNKAHVVFYPPKEKKMAPKDHVEPNKTEVRGLLFGAVSAFGFGIAGAIWHTKRKQAKEVATAAAAAAAEPSMTPTSMTNVRGSPIPVQQPGALATAYTPPKMTPEEYAIAKKDARFFAFKALGYGTLLALGGAGVLAAGIGYWLDVRNFKEFSDKLHEIIPRQTSRLRRMLGGSELVMKPEEEEELATAFNSDE
ncbi:hypothetical protein BX666DRAFT_2117279 [Dichotomocladium elegans]|nr:hypothetical protein BX666DRAFT_2117279 [Dichotomocladium elegans]